MRGGYQRQNAILYNKYFFQTNILPPRNRRRDQKNEQNRPRRVITGRRKDDGVFGAPEPIREIFLYRVRQDIERDVIASYLEKYNVICHDVTQMSNSDAKFKSFKITVPVSQMKHVMKADFWPENVRVRKWLRKKESEKEEGKESLSER